MDKNSLCYPSCLPEEASSTPHCHSIETNMHELLPENGIQFQGFPPWSSSPSLEGFTEDRATNSSQSHRQAEKRRRDRINNQLARLRKLIPKSEKMDKADLLERVVEQVKDLKRKTSEITKLLTIPTEIDEVTIECHNTHNTQEVYPNTNYSHHDNKNNKKNNNVLMIKATFCCEDRPDLITELVRALKGLNLTVIRADIACLGGRIKFILILLCNKLDIGASDDDQGGVYSNVSAIKQSLKAVLTRMVSWSSTTTSNFRVTSKRQRFFFAPS